MTTTQEPITIPVGRIQSLITEYEGQAERAAPEAAGVLRRVCADLRRSIEPEATP